MHLVGTEEVTDQPPAIRARYAILVDEEFSCLEFYMNRDTISWILKKVGCLSEITAYLF